MDIVVCLFFLPLFLFVIFFLSHTEYVFLYLSIWSSVLKNQNRIWTRLWFRCQMHTACVTHIIKMCTTAHRGCKFCGETLFFFIGLKVQKFEKPTTLGQVLVIKIDAPAGDWLVRQLVILNSKCGIKWTCSIRLGVKSLSMWLYFFFFFYFVLNTIHSYTERNKATALFVLWTWSKCCMAALLHSIALDCVEQLFLCKLCV